MMLRHNQQGETVSELSAFSNAKLETNPGAGLLEADAEQLSSLSDTNMAIRKASETAERRFQACTWMQEMVGPLDLPAEPCEEEVRLCLRNGLVLCNLINKICPGVVPKVVENPTLSYHPPEGAAALSAYQYFENVRNFLVAIEELKLPSFEASDLEKESVQAGTLNKVVDCILSLKAYHEWQLDGGHGFWKFGVQIKCPFLPKPHAKPFNAAGPLFHFTKGNGQWRTDDSEFMDECRSAWSNFDSNAAAWVQQICQKFVDVFFSRNKSSPDVNMPCEPLLKLVMVLLGDRQIEELPMLVEFMLKKVIEECEEKLRHRKDAQLKRSHLKIVEDLMVLKECSNQQEKAPSLLREVHEMQSVDRYRIQQSELQVDELKDLRLELKATRLHVQEMQFGWDIEVQVLNDRLQGLAQAADEYHKVVAENRQLYNQVQDLRGNIRVYCRVRPFLPGQDRSHSIIDYIGEKGSIVIANPAKQGKEQRKAFTFNKVYGPSAAQEEVFLDTQPLIRTVLDGFNVCIFAYGQTGSGKTYTMAGPDDASPKDWGVNFRALHDLFQISQCRENFVKYEVGVQMIEIYNEQVRDLLCLDGVNKKLEIHNSSQQNSLNVPDARMVPVNSTEDVLQLMNTGHRNRAVGCTALNERSSRSHSVLTVHVKGTDVSSGTILRGCLHLVDLAGSERIGKSEATGDRLKEAQHINKSLSALGDVIAALAHKSSHVPYRNSKLTQLLQDSLGRQAKTLMFVHISPDDDSYGETISTLKFAERVAAVELGTAQSNKESGEARDLKYQIALLKDTLSKKDGEIERLHRESRAKGSNRSHEKAKAKTGAVHGSGTRRPPLDVVHAVEGSQSPNMVQMCKEDRSQNLAQAIFPDEQGACSGLYKFREDKDPAKPRAANFYLEPVSPGSRSSNSDFSYQTSSPSVRGSGDKTPNKNKQMQQMLDKCLQQHTQHALSRHDRLSATRRNLTFQSSTDHHHQNRMAPPSLIPYPTGADWHLMSSEVKRAYQLSARDPDKGDCWLEGFQEEGEMSDYSEAEHWQRASVEEQRKVDVANGGTMSCQPILKRRGQQQDHWQSVGYLPAMQSSMDSKALAATDGRSVDIYPDKDSYHGQVLHISSASRRWH